MQCTMYNQIMKSAGYTLIELIVVLTILTIIGVLALANYKPFGEDQNLKNTVSDVQSILRQAQTGATTNTLCNGSPAATWYVELFKSLQYVILKCQVPPAGAIQIKALQLTGNTIDSISEAAGCSPTTDLRVSFAPLNSTATFLGSPTTCPGFEVTFKNSKTGNTKKLKIESGGRIYAP